MLISKENGTKSGETERQREKREHLTASIEAHRTKRSVGKSAKMQRRGSD
jgi:hypothetical protein